MLLYNDVSVGLELEYEGVHCEKSQEWLYEHDPDADSLWEVELDGSLRPRDMNTEFKFAGPLSGESVLEALELVTRVVDDPRYLLSWRCGMHVHVDNSQLPWSMAANQAVLACMMDRLWFGWDGTGRHESKFCVPISQVWESMIPNKTIRRPLFAGGRRALDAFKYSGLNIQRATPEDINTVEYRYPACTKSFDRMVEFVNLAMWCRQFATKFEDGESIVRTFVDTGTFTEWIKEYAPKALQPSWLVGVAHLRGPNGPTPLEIEAGVALSAAVSAAGAMPEPQLVRRAVPWDFLNDRAMDGPDQDGPDGEPELRVRRPRPARLANNADAFQWWVPEGGGRVEVQLQNILDREWGQVVEDVLEF